MILDLLHVKEHVEKVDHRVATINNDKMSHLPHQRAKKFYLLGESVGEEK